MSNKSTETSKQDDQTQDGFLSVEMPVYETETQEKPQSIKFVIISEILSWAKLIFFTLALAVILNQFVIVNASIPTGSMERAIMPNDRIIAFRLSYLFSEPDRFDIVIFRYPDNESLLYVKRIIGLPGETVIIRDGQVFINDSQTPLQDDFINEPPRGNYGPFLVPENSYFMLGDNRNNSEDSRAWTNPFVHRDGILGRAIFRYHRGFALLN